MSKTAFLFPGQGAQTVGMGRQLAERLPAARSLYERAGEILGYDLASLCFEGPADRLDSTVHSQPALFVTSLAAIELLREQSSQVVENCEAAAGLSLGEYTAIVFGGVIDFETGLDIVRQRGEAMQEASDATPSGMVSVLGLDQKRVEELCDQARAEDEVLQIANLLCPGNVVVSGSQDGCLRLRQLALEAGAVRVVPLAVAGAFHTPIMESAIDRLRKPLDSAPFQRSRIPIVSNVDASYHQEPDEIRQLLLKQVVQPVLWEDSIRRLVSDGFDTFYEVGPGRVLAGLLRRIDRKAACHSVLS